MAYIMGCQVLGLKDMGVRGFQGSDLPFQWSDHILCEDGRVEHREYLCAEDKDPREEFIRSLLDVLGKKGSIVTYTGYEERIIKGLVEEFAGYRGQLNALPARIRDLHKIIRGHYYNPAFHGSFSIKSVLPAVLPEMSYENLEIQEGQLASLEYLRMIDPSMASEEKEKIRRIGEQ